MRKPVLMLLALTAAVMLAAGCTQKQDEIIFADAGWDSNKIHNAIAGYVAETVFGYSWKETPGGTTILHEGLLKGEVDVHMEVWSDNIPSYPSDVEQSKLQIMGINYDDNIQGIYVPRYVIEGDPARGIAPMAPNLKFVWDLPNYRELFRDPEQKDKGRLYGAIPGWAVDTVMHNKFMYYGLDESFVYFRPGSDAALSAAFTSAYEKGEPIVGYYWEPTWLLGKYDMVLLEDALYDPAIYEQGMTACPSVKVTVGVSNGFAKNNPAFCDFLRNYHTSSALTSQALSYMQDTGSDYTATAKWFLKNNMDLVEQWLTAPQLQKLKNALELTAPTGTKSSFPFVMPIDVTTVDNAVKGFSVSAAAFFQSITDFLNGLIAGVHAVLRFIPWWLLLAMVFTAGWRMHGKLLTGVLYAVGLSFIGFVGLWDLMNETLSIVITSVIISLALGFPLGILVAGNDRADRIARPILDTMQTMPVFVYLIPAILFFGLGKPPAVIATTIYAIVPVIRLTSHGIRQVDPEVVEAAKAYGSTRMQTLIKVQIPQALPTIMTGANQTLMMAMAMVVTCSMIGASGLGMEVLIGVNRIEIGRGLIAGTSVVIIAIVLDRLTQGYIKRKEGKRNG